MEKFLTIFFTVIALNCTAESNNNIFSIGTKDGSSAEFALYPDKYNEYLSHFGGVHEYNIGYSRSKNNFPYAIPGPLDVWGGGGYWAGYYTRHFPTIYFNIDKLKSTGQSKLNMYLCGVGKSDETLIRVRINGHLLEKTIKGDDSNEVLKNKQKGSESEISISFSNEYLCEGGNKIEFNIYKGSWIMLDCIDLVSDSKIEIRQGHSTLVKSIYAPPFVSKDQKQAIHFDINHLTNTKDLTFVIDGEKIIREVENGKSIQEFLLSEKSSRKKSVVVAALSDGTLIAKQKVNISKTKKEEYIDHVDMLMGTGNSRWMFKPCSSLPYSMVQIGPDNQNSNWKAGYEYTIDNITGFNHICDWTMTGFLMQPTCGELQVNPGDENDPDSGYRSRIDKKQEVSHPGYYSVYMTDTDIKAELTSTRRAAMQRYTFPKSSQSRVLIDMYAPNEYNYDLIDAKITKVSDTQIEGYAHYANVYTGYSLDQDYKLHFVIEFNKPFKTMGGWVNNITLADKSFAKGESQNFPTKPTIHQNIDKLDGKGDVGIYLNFDTEGGEEILVRSAISLVDIYGAHHNLKKEIVETFAWDFNAVVASAGNTWNEYLGCVEIETTDYLQKRKFYTNLYRALSARAIWSDYDGRYRDEMEVVRQLNKPQDAIVSGEYWNTFFNLQQLYNLVAPEMSETWARSAIELYNNSGWLNTDPTGIEHTGVMVAMHGISQLWGTWQAGIQTFDLEKAYEASKKMMTTSPQKYEGGGTVGVEHLDAYMKYDYVPLGYGYISNTMEYAYDDWCVSQMAKYLGYEEDYKYFFNRSHNWKNIIDKESGYARPKNDQGKWIEPLNPYYSSGFVEGNAFNFTWFAPHMPEKLVEWIGRDRFVERLDEAMQKSSLTNFNAAGDAFDSAPVNHGNQTSMQVGYMFNHAGAHHLSQKWIRAIQEQYYGTTPYDAYPGDEDLGQMSSWFVMSAIGLFQMDGGCALEPVYQITTPRYPKITIHLREKYGRGKTFVIEAKNASKENKYVKSLFLNGKEVKDFTILQKEVFKGGKLVLEMTDKMP